MSDNDSSDSGCGGCILVILLICWALGIISIRCNCNNKPSPVTSQEEAKQE